MWDTTTGVSLFSLIGHTGLTTSVAWSPNGAKIATTALDNTIRIWDATTHQILITIQHPSSVYWVSWSPDNTKIASAGSDGQVRVWDATTGQILTTFQGHTSSVEIVAWSPNGSKIASGSLDATIRVWDVQSGQQIDVIQSAAGAIVDLAWKPDSSQLAYIGEDSGILGGLPQLIDTPQISLRNGTGLRGQYYDVLNFTTLKFFRINSPIDFNWGTGTPDAAIAADTFSVRWTGKVEPLYSEAYTFFVTHNDGARLWVNGQQIINNWTNITTAVTDSGTITLAAGLKYDIVLEYYENTGSASVKLEWQSVRQARQVIPKSQLYPSEGQLACAERLNNLDSVWVANAESIKSPSLSYFRVF